jgi:short-subunit dehydrogenase
MRNHVAAGAGRRRMANESRGRALVTGASSGIGEEFARQLAAKRYDVVLVARRTDRLAAIAAEISEAHGRKTEVIAADLSTKKGVSAVAERLKKGDIAVLVNSAGFGTQGEFAQLPLGRETQELNVNIIALTQLTHAAAGPMIENGHGAIINLGSVGSFEPVPYMSTYAATKAYVLSFSEGLHEELKPHGVTVTCVCPGVVHTEFQEQAGMDRGKMPSMGLVTPEKVVSDALKGAAKKKAIVIPGAMNQAAAQMVRFAPRGLVRRVSGDMFKDVSA